MSDDAWQSKAASDQLNRILAFFARVESKSSTLFAINTGMAAVFGVHLRLEHLSLWHVTIPAIISVSLIAASLLYLYFAANPEMKGGARSLVYFREIAARTEADYLAEIKACTEDKYTEQMFAQVWRNSQILTQKFECVKCAFICTIAAVVPWAVTLMTAGLQKIG